MITESAIVTRRDGELVELELQRNATCGQCELNKGCGTGALGRLMGHRSKPIQLHTDRDLEPGDRVMLGLPESALVKASLMIYGLPLLGMVVAGILSALVTSSEFLVVVAAFAGFFAGFKFARIIANALEDEQLLPYIIDVDLNPGPRARS